MASSPDKITGTSPTPFPGGCVEAEEGFETEVTEEEPLVQVTVCKTNENGFYLSDGRKILFTEATITHLSEGDWVQFGLDPIGYKEGNYLMRSANLYAFLGPEFEENDKQQCYSKMVTKFTGAMMLEMMRKIVEKACPPLTLRPHIARDFSFREWRDYLSEHDIEWGSVREGSSEQISLNEPKEPAGDVTWYYSDGEFANLSVTVQGFTFSHFLEDYLEDYIDGDGASSDHFQSLLQNTGEIEVLYTSDGEYIIQGIDGEIPPEIESALSFLALDYVNGAFIDERRDPSE